LNSWWWMERTSETCRVLFQNKYIWETGAFSWFYYRSKVKYSETSTPISTVLLTADICEPKHSWFVKSLQPW